MSITRPYWSEKIESAWKSRPLVWLSGVRRLGKTTITRALGDVVYLNCDLPSVQRELEDPEAFFSSFDGKRLVLDEVHRLRDPALVLKIGADEFGGKLKIIATGSSTLAATRKFSDTLTDRKRNVRLVPVLPEECAAFGVKDLRERMRVGGLPPALLAQGTDLEFYSEWRDSFYARDVQEIFHVEKRQPFLHTLEWLLRSNGQMAEVTELAKAAGISRPTAVKYLEVLETTEAITVIRPFHGGNTQELVKQPKIYAFDTGFVCHARGWDTLRPSDLGGLLENLVLESLLAASNTPKIHYWRTKQRHEIDFVVPSTRGQVHAIECKWKMDEFEPRSLKVFREEYPAGTNWVVCSDAPRAISRTKQGLEIRYVPIQEFRRVFGEE